MKGTRRGKSGRGSAGSGRGNFQGRGSSGMTSQPQIQPIGVTETSLETGQSSNRSQGPLLTVQISSGPLQRTSPEIQSSRNLEESIWPSPEAETGAGTRFLKDGGQSRRKVDGVQ